MKFFYFLLQLTIFCQVVLSKKVRHCQLQKNDEACLIVTVTKVLNGNTVEFRDAINDNATNKIVRLDGLQGPSINSTLHNIYKSHLSRFLGKKTLTLIIRKSKDINGDLVGTFYKKGKDINKKMISHGYAWCFKRLVCPEGYFDATVNAILKSKGIWESTNMKKSKGNRKVGKVKRLKVLKGEYQVSVVKVIDGDTVYVKKINSPNETMFKVRMSGIDAPELKQFFGRESKKYLQQLVDSSTTLQLSVEGTDMYGRQLATLKSGTVDINKSMVLNGHAWCYRYTKCPSSYRTAMTNAKSTKKGLFSQINPVTPWDWRQQNKI